jgi:hypothetical protein
MIVHSVPKRLKYAAGCLFLSVPWVAAEVVLVNRAPWWNLPFLRMGYWSLGFTLICSWLAYQLINARKWAYHLIKVLSLLWILATAWIAIGLNDPPLAFFTVLLMAFSVGQLKWLKHELERSFFDPQLAWYQGLPKPIPGLSCCVGEGEDRVNLKVSRIDSEGAFVYSAFGKSEILSSFEKNLEREKLKMEFVFRNRKVFCEGIPTLTIARGQGAGIRFAQVSADTKKEIGDFIEILRGEGYV